MILDASVALGRHAALSCVVASDTACVCQVSAQALEQVVRANADLSEQVLALAMRWSSRHAEVGVHMSQGMVQPDTPTKLSRQRTAPSNKIGSGARRGPAEVVHSKEAAVQLRQEIEDALVDGVIDASEQLLIDAKQAELDKMVAAARKVDDDKAAAKAAARVPGMADKGSSQPGGDPWAASAAMSCEWWERSVSHVPHGEEAALHDAADGGCPQLTSIPSRHAAAAHKIESQTRLHTHATQKFRKTLKLPPKRLGTTASPLRYYVPTVKLRPWSVAGVVRTNTLPKQPPAVACSAELPKQGALHCHGDSAGRGSSAAETGGDWCQKQAGILQEAWAQQKSSGRSDSMSTRWAMRTPQMLQSDARTLGGKDKEREREKDRRNLLKIAAMHRRRDWQHEDPDGAGAQLLIQSSTRPSIGSSSFCSWT